MKKDLPALVNSLAEKYDPVDAVEWDIKFKRKDKFPPFDTGELVNITGYLDRDRCGLKIHIDEYGRVADNFYLKNIIDPENAEKYMGIPFESVVRVLGYRHEKYMISNCQNYDAVIVDITSLPLINPTLDELCRTSNSHAVIWGEFAGFKESGMDRFLKSQGLPEGTNMSGYSGNGICGRISLVKPDCERVSIDVSNPLSDILDNNTGAVIITNEQKEIEISMPTGKIVFSGGELENIKNKVPEKGDIVRISARISENKFYAAWCSPCILEKASEKRYARTVKLLSSIEANLSKIDQYISQHEYKEARNLIAETRTMELTSKQLDMTYELFQRMPELERPVFTSRDEYMGTMTKNYYVKSIDEGYGSRIESMTKDEFIEFAKHALSGEAKKNDVKTDATYLLRIAPDMGFDDACIEEVSRYALEKRIEKVKGHDMMEFNDDYVIGNIISNIWHRKTPDANQIINDTYEKFRTLGIKAPYDLKECHDILNKNLIKGGKDEC